MCKYRERVLQISKLVQKEFPSERPIRLYTFHQVSWQVWPGLLEEWTLPLWLARRFISVHELQITYHTTHHINDCLLCSNAFILLVTGKRRSKQSSNELNEHKNNQTMMMMVVVVTTTTTMMMMMTVVVVMMMMIMIMIMMMMVMMMTMVIVVWWWRWWWCWWWWWWMVMMAITMLMMVAMVIVVRWWRWRWRRRWWWRRWSWGGCNTFQSITFLTHCSSFGVNRSKWPITLISCRDCRDKWALKRKLKAHF